MPRSNERVSAEFLQYVEGLTIWSSFVRQTDELPGAHVQGRRLPWPAVRELPMYRAFHDAATQRLDVLRSRRLSRYGGALDGDNPFLSAVIHQRALWTDLMKQSRPDDLIEALKERLASMTADDALSILGEESIRETHFEVLQTEVHSVRSASFDVAASYMTLASSSDNVQVVSILNQLASNGARCAAAYEADNLIPRSANRYPASADFRYTMPIGHGGSEAFYLALLEGASADAQNALPLQGFIPMISLRIGEMPSRVSASIEK